MHAIDSTALASVGGGETAAYNRGYAGTQRFIENHMAHWGSPWNRPTGGPNNERFLNVPYIGPAAEGLGTALRSQKIVDWGRGVSDATRDTRPWNNK